MSAHGSPGTVYIENNIGDDKYKLLLIDNLNRDEKFQVLLNEPGISEYKFDEVRLVRKAVLALAKVCFDYFYILPVNIYFTYNFDITRILNTFDLS